VDRITGCVVCFVFVHCLTDTVETASGHLSPSMPRFR
jgi:hypothetical protein